MMMMMTNAAKEFVRQGVLAEEARLRRESVKLDWVSAGRYQHVTYVEYADHFRPKVRRTTVCKRSEPLRNLLY